HRLPVPVCRRGSMDGARPSPRLLSDAGPNHWSGLRGNGGRHGFFPRFPSTPGDFKRCLTTPVAATCRARGLWSRAPILRAPTVRAPAITIGLSGLNIEKLLYAATCVSMQP